MIPFLRRGDQLPAVASAQILLNQRLLPGQMIDVDGIYGEQTESAVKKYQVIRRVHPSGALDARCWQRLLDDAQYQTLEAIDVTDVSDQEIYDPDQMDQITARNRLLYSYGMSDGVRSVRQRLLQNGRPGRVMLLQFHGHGHRGSMGVSFGTGVSEIGSYFSSKLSVELADSLRRFLSPLSPLFSRFASVELHGCKTGGGASGRQLLQMLANTWQVPVTAGLRNQYGHDDYMFRFEGPTYSAFPGGGTLRTWVRSLPESALYCRS